MVWSGRAGEIALGKVDDADGHVIEALTGPQVAWGMARGRVGSFGGKILNTWWMWTALSVLFFLGLVDRRRIRSWHTADLLGAALVRVLAAVLQPRPHLHERVRSVRCRSPTSLVRTLVDRLPRPRARTRRSPGRVWLLAGLAVFLGGLRIGLNLETPRGVIDVGYAGVIGADRILDGQAPYGHMPDTAGTRLRPGRRRRRDPRPHPDERPLRVRQRRAATPTGRRPTWRTSPPSLALGWSGKWDSLPAAHATAIAFDLLVVLGLLLVGRRFGGTPLAVGARLRLGRVPVHRRTR